MNLNQTTNANRLFIGIFGKRNTGKSSLINMITNQNVSIVSEFMGTTTDPVKKTMEINGVGPCLFIDTAGFDDVGALGNLRNQKTLELINTVDVAIILINSREFRYELEFIKKLKDTPKILVINKCDLLSQKNVIVIKKEIFDKTGLDAIEMSTKTKKNLDLLIKRLVDIKPYQEKSILNGIVTKNDLVLLVMPQDIQAPQGRLILPQVQIIRDLLDNKCMIMCSTRDNFSDAIKVLNQIPKLIITDSQIFDYVYNNKPQESLITSFSVLFAKYKGDIKEFINGAQKIDDLSPDSKILIAEACTHVPLEEDIGRIKIPRLLKKYLGFDLKIDFVRGNDFPGDLSDYELIIHCGACMFNKKFMMSRVNQAKDKNIAITNYGVVIAKLNNMLDKIFY